MKTLTTDFSGTYDYPAEEAEASAAHFEFLIDTNDYTRDELCQLIIKERDHWIKVFGPDDQGQADMKRFAEVFNERIAERLNFYI